LKTYVIHIKTPDESWAIVAADLGENDGEEERAIFATGRTTNVVYDR
jgi:hypothetical protein